MSESWDQARLLIENHALKLGSAIAILVGGWFLALLISSLVKKAVEKTRLGKSIEKLVRDESHTTSLGVDRWISRIVFILLMIFVFIAFFDVLGLTAVNEPLNSFLVQIFEFAPRLIGPIALFVIAWIAATILKFLVQKVLGNSHLNEWISKWAGLEGDFQNSAGHTLGNVIYWAVFLIFSLAILDTLNLEGLLDPLQQLFEQVLGFLPNVLAALLILCFGWFVAKIVQRIITNLTATLGADKLSEQMGLRNALGHKPLSGSLGVLAYILILIPVLIASLNALKLQSITMPVSEMLEKVLLAVPDIFAAGMVLVVAFYLGRFICALVKSGLTNLGFNRVLAKLGIGEDPTDYNTILGKMGIGEAPTEGLTTPSEIVANTLFGILLLFAGIEALELIGFGSLALLLTQFVLFCGQVLLGLIIFGFGLFVSNAVAKAIRSSGNAQANLLATLSRVAIMVLAGAMALQQMGLAERIINLAFGILLGALALAAAIAFGIGGQKVAESLLKDFVSSLRSHKKR